MRIKALICLAALALGAFTSMAQVYSANIVGYVNVTASDGTGEATTRGTWLTAIANPLKNMNVANTLANLVTTIPDTQFGCNYFAWVTNRPGYFSTYTYFGGGMWDSDVSMLPGEPGFLALNGLSGSATITFVGEVMQGSNNHDVYAGLNMLSAYTSRGGTLDQLGVGSLVGFGENAFIWNFPSQVYITYTSFGGGPGGWDNGGFPGAPADPTVGVAEPFLINVAAGGTWTETWP